MSAPDKNGWMPIETAPEEGYFFICEAREGSDYEASVEAAWREPTRTGFAITVTRDCEIIESTTFPTHWQPLPEPPEDHS